MPAMALRPSSAALAAFLGAGACRFWPLVAASRRSNSICAACAMSADGSGVRPAGNAARDASSCTCACSDQGHMSARQMRSGSGGLYASAFDGCLHMCLLLHGVQPEAGLTMSAVALQADCCCLQAAQLEQRLAAGLCCMPAQRRYLCQKLH